MLYFFPRNTSRFPGLHAVIRVFELFISKFGRMLKQRIQTTVLDNGVTVMTDDAERLFCFGRRLDRAVPATRPWDECGLSHFTSISSSGRNTALRWKSLRPLGTAAETLTLIRRARETGFYAQVSREDVPLRST